MTGDGSDRCKCNLNLSKVLMDELGFILLEQNSIFPISKTIEGVSGTYGGTGLEAIGDGVGTVTISGINMGSDATLFFIVVVIITVTLIIGSIFLSADTTKGGLGE